MLSIGCPLRFQAFEPEAVFVIEPSTSMASVVEANLLGFHERKRFGRRKYSVRAGGFVSIMIVKTHR